MNTEKGHGGQLIFEDSPIGKLAEIAEVVNERTENIGARRLHTSMEKLLEEISFDAPDSEKRTFVIDAAYVSGKLDSLVKNEDLSRYIL